MRNKKERLATHLRAFIKQIEHDLNFKKEIFDKYDRLEIPAGYYSHIRKISEPFKPEEDTTLSEEAEDEDNVGVPVYDPGNLLNNRVINTATLFEHSAWLLCETAAENRMRNHSRRELQQAPDLSSVSKKLKNKALPIFDKWSKKTLLDSQSIQEMHLESFWPDEKSTVQTLLTKLKKLIDHPNNIHEVRAAESCRNDIIQYLFTEMDKKLLSGTVIRHFLTKYKLTLQEEEADPHKWKNIIPIVNKPGRRSVSSEKIMKYVKHLANWFLRNPVKFYTVGQTILIIWCELAVAHSGRRICSLNDILSIQENDIGSRKRACGNTYHIILKQRPVTISKFLCDMLLCIADRRADNPKIFSINRSTIEEHLKTATLELGYDPELTPVTSETFLERPIECGLDEE